MTTIPVVSVDIAVPWLAKARAAVASRTQVWPLRIEGPRGEPVVVALGHGVATFPQTALEVEVAPGVFVDLADVRMTVG